MRGRDTSCESTWSPDRGYWDQPIRTSSVSFSPAWPWGILLQEGFKVLPFPWQSLWKQLVKLDYFKEQLLRICEEMNRSTRNQQAMCCCLQTGTIWAEEVLCDPGMAWSRSQVCRLRFDKSWWAEPDGGKNQALLLELRLLWRLPESTEWDSSELWEVQDQNGEYMRHSDLQNLKDGKNLKTFFLPERA